MLKDITLGQYFPGNSFIHRLDPRSKLIITLIYIILLFTIKNMLGYLIAFAFLLAIIFFSKIKFSLIYRSVKPLAVFIFITALLNILYTPGRVLLSVWFIKITYEGIIFAVFMAVRIILLVIVTSLMTYTTSPIMLTDAMEQLFGPLKKIKAPVHEVAMMMTIALRFIPTLIDETQRIMSAQRARGADFESGNLINRAKSLIPLLVPLFISAFKRAEELAVAMDCRCYRGGQGRTRLKQLKMGNCDIVAWGATLVFGAAIIFFNYWQLIKMLSI